MWWDILIAIGTAVLLPWAALIAALVIARPRGALLREALRLLPDLLRLLPRLAADRTLPRGVRVRLALLLAYLASPVDLVPDFIPVVGYADDASQPGGGVFLTKDSGSAAFDLVTYEFAKTKIGDVFWVEAPPKAAKTQEKSSR